ncbi:MAG: hypothetical protein LQ338_004757 [Usnochroma carphineum]|nr:MAG: hypothetical protein LQ338_004757 [Usnochroma carphineum]
MKKFDWRKDMDYYDYNQRCERQLPDADDGIFKRPPDFDDGDYTMEFRAKRGVAKHGRAIPGGTSGMPAKVPEYMSPEETSGLDGKAFGAHPQQDVSAK